MSNKYLKLAQQLKKGQSKLSDLRIEARPFNVWVILPYKGTFNNDASEYDENGHYIPDDNQKSVSIAKARKDKKKKPEVKTPFYTTKTHYGSFLCLTLEFTVVKRVA